MGILLLGTAAHSLFFVITERTIGDELSAMRLCALLGTSEFTFLVAYNLALGMIGSLGDGSGGALVRAIELVFTMHVIASK